MAGSVRHDFKIGDKIGVGLFGEEYVAKDSQQLCAKKLLITSKNNSYTLEKLKKLVDIKGKHLVRYLYVSAEEESLWLFTERWENGNLHDYLHTYGARLADEWIDTFMEQCLDGLVYLHESKPAIVHGSITLGNIIVEASGSDIVLKLTDYGLAPLASNFQELHRRTDMAFSPPEYFKDDHCDWSLSLSVDIFSMGLVFLVLITFDGSESLLRPASSASRARKQTWRPVGEEMARHPSGEPGPVDLFEMPCVHGIREEHKNNVATMAGAHPNGRPSTQAMRRSIQRTTSHRQKEEYKDSGFGSDLLSSEELRLYSISIGEDSGRVSSQGLEGVQSKSKQDNSKKLQQLAKKVENILTQSNLRCLRSVRSIFAAYIEGHVCIITTNKIAQDDVQKELSKNLEQPDFKLLKFKCGSERLLMQAAQTDITRGIVVHRENDVHPVSRSIKVGVCAWDVRKNQPCLITCAHAVFPQQCQLDDIIESHQHQLFDQDLDIFTDINGRQEVIGKHVYALFGAFPFTENQHSFKVNLDIAVILVDEVWFNHCSVGIRNSLGRSFIPITTLKVLDNTLSRGHSLAAEMTGGHISPAYGVVQNVNSIGFTYNDQKLEREIIAKDLKPDDARKYHVHGDFGNEGDSGLVVTSPLEPPMRQPLQQPPPQEAALTYGLLRSAITDDAGQDNTYFITSMEYSLQAVKTKFDLDLKLCGNPDQPMLNMEQATAEIFGASIHDLQTSCWYMDQVKTRENP